jgi:transcriptional regulator with XRE-family HTH domain
MECHMARKFSELRAKMSPEAQSKAKSLAKKYLAELPLDELRVARNMSQENLAQVLGVKQNAVSKLERRTDMYVSSLRNVIRAMGGDLRIEAVFPEGVVVIDQFKHVHKCIPTIEVDVSSKLPPMDVQKQSRPGHLITRLKGRSSTYRSQKKVSTNQYRASASS